MINPELITPSALPSLPLSRRKELPKISGIYFALDSLEVVQYIGQSINIRNRWLNHHRQSELDAVGNVSIAYLEISEPLLLSEIEWALIEYFNPPLNRSRRRSPGVQPKVELTELSQTRVKDSSQKTFIIEPDLHKSLKLQAKRERRSIGSLLNWLIAKYLEEQQGLEIQPTIQHGGDRKSDKGASQS